MSSETLRPQPITATYDPLIAHTTTTMTDLLGPLTQVPLSAVGGPPMEPHIPQPPQLLSSSSPPSFDGIELALSSRATYPSLPPHGEAPTNYEFPFAENWESALADGDLPRFDYYLLQ